MKPAPFNYHAPTSVSGALELLAEHGDEAGLLAGGQSLVPLLVLRRVRFGHLIDLSRIVALEGVTTEEGWVRIGAMTRQRVMERDPQVARAVPLLALATPAMGPRQVRNRGTVGGSLAHDDSAAEYPAIAAALGAELETSGRLLIGARFPIWPPGTGFAIEKVARRAGDFAIAGAVVACSPGRCGLALFGVGRTRRTRTAEEAMLAGASERDVAQEAIRGIEPPGDVLASREARLRIAARVVAVAVARARKESHA